MAPPPLPPSPVTPPVLMPLPLDALPEELLDQVLLRVGPRPSHLLPCLTASRRMHAAAARALCAAVRFESVRQRAAFARLATAAAAATSGGAEGLSDASGGRSLTAPCGLTPAAIAKRLVALDFGLRPAEAPAVPRSKTPKGGRRRGLQQQSGDVGGGDDDNADGTGAGRAGAGEVMQRAESKVEVWPRVGKAATASSVMVAADYVGAAAAGSDPLAWASVAPVPAGQVVVTAAGRRRRSAATIPVPLFLAPATEPGAMGVGASVVAELPPPVAPAADFDDGAMRRERRASSSSTVSSASSSSTLSTFSSSSSVAAYGSRWDHRFIGHDLSLLLCGGGLGSSPIATTAVCGAQLRYLSLSGCHVDDATVAEVLGRLSGGTGECGLEVLDLSYSTVRAGTLGCVAETCGRLLELDVSGIFRLRRLPAGLLVGVAAGCQRLRRLVVLDSPDVGAAVVAACARANRALEVVREEDGDGGGDDMGGDGAGDDSGGWAWPGVYGADDDPLGVGAGFWATRPPSPTSAVPRGRAEPDAWGFPPQWAAAAAEAAAAAGPARGVRWADIDNDDDGGGGGEGNDGGVGGGGGNDGGGVVLFGGVA
ncbi:hypothetical protein HK405_000173 [Cladochytrium tenue]|nr:hypothetical protein HK405_000173 [Cladochytrium tenue]